MSNYEGDELAQNSLVVPQYVKDLIWMFFDAEKDKKIKLKWGFFRPSFRLRDFEPLFAKIIGPRST